MAEEKKIQKWRRAKQNRNVANFEGLQVCRRMKYIRAIKGGTLQHIVALSVTTVARMTERCEEGNYKKQRAGEQSKQIKKKRHVNTILWPGIFWARIKV